jgi:putative membrane protein
MADGKKRAGTPAAIFGGIVVLAIGLIALFDPSGWYEWVKALHVITVISWMVGLLYLPRLFVYHSEALLLADVQAVEARADMLVTMETRLMKIIMTPAMILTWISGLTLVGRWGFSEPWLWLKLSVVIALTVFHFWMAGQRKKLAAGTSDYSPKGWRALNEIPTLGLIIIVIMVIVKPF